MIERLVERSKSFDEHKTDYGPAPAHLNFRMNNAGGIDISPDLTDNGGASKHITEHAFRQMCGRLGTVAHPGSSRSLPATYLMTCPPSLRADNVNWWIGEAREQKWFARLYQDDIRAILSDRYVTVDITETLEWVDEALESGGQDSVELVKTVVTPDVLHLRVLFQNVSTNGGDAPYAIGAYFTNGETGNRRMGVYPLVQRHACTNSIIIPSDEFAWSHIHVGNRSVLKRLFIDSIFHVLEGSVEALDKLLRSQAPMENFRDRVSELVEDRGWTMETRDKILIGSEGYESLFGLVQGVSAAANAVEDPDLQADMQIEAGRLLL